MMKRLAFIAMLALGLSACATSGGNVPKTRTMNYEQFGITRLNVNKIQVVNAFVPSYRAPNVEHQFYLPPYVALRDWARNRYHAVGTMGTAKIEILDASITQKDIPLRNQSWDMWTDGMETELRMRLQVRMEINSANYSNLPYAEAIVSRTIRFPNGTTLAQRDAEMQNTLVEAIGQLDQLMTKTVQTKLGNLIR